MFLLVYVWHHFRCLGKRLATQVWLAANLRFREISIVHTVEDLLLLQQGRNWPREREVLLWHTPWNQKCCHFLLLELYYTYMCTVVSCLLAWLGDKPPTLRTTHSTHWKVQVHPYLLSLLKGSKSANSRFINKKAPTVYTTGAKETHNITSLNRVEREQYKNNNRKMGLHF